LSNVIISWQKTKLKKKKKIQKYYRNAEGDYEHANKVIPLANPFFLHFVVSVNEDFVIFSLTFK